MTNMKDRRSLSTLLVLGLLAVVSSTAEKIRKHHICPWTHGNGQSIDFRCSNGVVVGRSLFCDGSDDCGDNSDERYCGRVYNDCPRSMIRCSDSVRCIPNYWLCDDIDDCPGGTDELKCGATIDNTYTLVERAVYWLYKEKNSKRSLVDKSAVALYLASKVDSPKWKIQRTEFAYEASIQLLSRLSWRQLQEIPSSELASYVNAFLVTCLNPRNFHGMDIIRELRSRVDRQNQTDPYVLLSLCNAGETLTKLDKERLVETFRNKKRIFWTDIQAVVVMALTCASKQLGSDPDSMETLREMAMELKHQQYRNGTVENLHTTALVMQALLSLESDADPDNFDEQKALQQILAMQEKDWSFGSFMNTYYVLPVLNCRSLVDVGSVRCEHFSRDETSSVRETSDPKIHVRYSVWIGNEIDMERTLNLTVPQTSSLYEVMEMAAEIDSRFRCEYTVKIRKPYVNAVYELQNDPEAGKFWFLYTVHNGNPIISQDSPADVTPKANDHFVMWYRTGPWLD